MKRIILSMIATAMLAVGCQKEEIGTAVQSETVTISVTAEDAIATRADEAAATRYIMVAYHDANYSKVAIEQTSNTDGQFEVILDRSKDYHFLFWADADGADVYNTDNLKTVALKDNQNPVEAWAGRTAILKDDAAPSYSVALSRAVAKVQLKETGKLINGSTLTMTYKHPKAFNLTTGEEVADATTAWVERSETINIDDNINGTIAPVTLTDKAIYLFATQKDGVQTLTNVKFSMDTEISPGDIENEWFIIQNVPFEANKVTNIVGRYTDYAVATFNMDVDEAWEGDITHKYPAFNSTFTNLPSNASTITEDTWVISGDATDFSKLKALLNTVSAGRKINLELPDVTAIPEFAFEFVESLNSLSFPKAQSIGDMAFNSCSGLTSVTISEGVQIIGNSAFYKCEALTTVIINEGVQIIGRHAFRSCTNLSSVTIPSSVTSIDIGVFIDCYNLTEINVAQGNTAYANNDNDGVLYDIDKTTIIAFPTGRTGSFDIPDGVKSIGNAAFGTSALTTIEIPSSVTTISNEAFILSALTSIDIPSTVETIGDMAFFGCNDLTSITVRWTDAASIPTVSNLFPDEFRKNGSKSITIPNLMKVTYETVAGWSYYELVEATE